MATNIFSIGQSALAAAQAAQATTSHNLANAATPGYNRQVVVQSTAGSINYGYGFIGQGTNVAEIKRVYNDFLYKQVLASQTAASSLDTYATQISQINDLIADTSAGLSPALQSFFSSMQNLASTPDNAGARQALLSSGETLAARFQSLNEQLAQSRTGINSQMMSTVATINAYANQIQGLNAAIRNASAASGLASNDLLDQRDQAVADLNKIVKVTTVPQDNGSLSVFIGTGQPLVLGNTVSTLVATPASNDPRHLQISYQTNGNKVLIADAAFTGGSLGGLLQYRSETLDVAQNTLGRIAIALGSAFNAQHQLGQDQNGNLGTNFFNIGTPTVYGDNRNSASAQVTATITDPSQLSTSDYTLAYDGSKYTITRLFDGKQTVLDPSATPPGTFPVSVDGVTYAAPTMAAGDSFLIKPTANGAASLSMAITNTQLVAAAVPVLTASNAVTDMGLATSGAGVGGVATGTGVVTAASVDKSAFTPNATQAYTYSSAAPATLSLTPPADVTVTTTTGVSTLYPAGTPLVYSAGATIVSGGVSFVLSGAPAAGDTFRFAPLPANTGTATISSGTIDASFSPSLLPTGTRIGLTFGRSPAQFTLSGLAATVTSVMVTHADGSVTNTTPLPSPATFAFTPGDQFTLGVPASPATIPATSAGMSFTINGQPADGDQFFIAPNTNGVSDNRNAQALNALQTANTIGNSSFQGSYSQLVSMIGNKTNEITVTNNAENARLTSIQQEQQSESGVNQDEELSNMIKNQTAYQAAAKIIQAASDMLNVLFTLGN